MSASVDHHELRQAALAALILEQRFEERNRAIGAESQMSDGERKERGQRVRAMTASTAHWLRHYTRTYNPHWKEERKPSPHEPFPDWEFLDIVCEYLEDDTERVKLIEKSRDMMLTWVIAGYFTLQAMLVPEREIIVMSQTDDKGIQVIDYAKQLYQSQPSELRAEFPVPKPTDKQSRSEFLVGSSVIKAIPSGAGKIRSYHPWGYFSDETAFQPESGESYDEALAACQKIVLNSTASPGWYFDFTMDATTADL